MNPSPEENLRTGNIQSYLGGQTQESLLSFSFFFKPVFFPVLLEMLDPIASAPDWGNSETLKNMSIDKCPPHTASVTNGRNHNL